MKKILIFLIVLTLSVLLAIVFAGYKNAKAKTQPDFAPISSYKDIPGITAEEIEAIEALKQKRGSLSYGSLLSTETFLLPNGSYAGFTTEYCQLLSQLFGIEFVQKTYTDWGSLVADLDNLNIDFSSDFYLNPMAEQKTPYHKTQPIAERSLRVFLPNTAVELVTETDINGRNIGFLSNSGAYQAIKTYYPTLNFNAVNIDTFSQALEQLKDGIIDLLVVDSALEYSCQGYDCIQEQNFFPLAYMPITMVTANSQLEAIISVINKYLAWGGIDKLYQLYGESTYEYANYKLRQSLSTDERDYLDNMLAQGGEVRIAMEYDNYPISFYNEAEQEFQGVSVDVLAEISKLTGLSFIPVSGKNDSLTQRLEQLRTGEAAMIASLIYTEERAQHFIWSDPYTTTHFVLISKADYPNIKPYQVIRSSVGTVEKTVAEQMFFSLFPDCSSTSYDTPYDGLDALERGEIELLMIAEHTLLAQLNYREKPGYKVNIRFDIPVDSMFGFNNNQALLCSIINKAQLYVDTAHITDYWSSRTFDYNRALAHQRNYYLLVVVAVLFTALMAVIFLLLKNKRLGADLLNNQEELHQAAQAAQEASRAKTAFLANMSHEIRTPMHAIIGFSELALGDNVSYATKLDYLKKIETSANSLLQIINDVLDISKIEAGKIELENIPFDLREVFQVCQNIISPAALDKGISLYCYAEPSVGKKMLGDPTRLSQVLLNLLSNAVKFTHTGMVKAFSEIVSVTEDSVTMRFEVKDSGIGMTPEQIENIFTPFMQGDSSTTRKYGGTGLGLSITQNLIDLMGGQLTVKSEPGLGSIFSFQLTFKTTNEPVSQPVGEIAADKHEKPLFNGDILLCEDNEINQQVMLEHLSRVGINTVTASNGKEGVEQVRQRMEAGEKPFDLIFMDIHMPVMDGLEAAQALLELGSKTPIVALTANVMVSDRNVYKENNMIDYLPKPFHAHELWACLQKYFTPLGGRAGRHLPQGASKPFIEDEKQRHHIYNAFIKDHSNNIQDINSALAAGDIKLAHRLAHTLKGTAGLFGQKKLREAAQTVEMALKGEIPWNAEEQMPILERELNAVLEELKAEINGTPSSPQAQVVDNQQICELLKQLEPLLLACDSDSLEYTKKLRDIPGGELLAELIEDYDFDLARQTLASIKRDLGCEE